MTLTKKLNRIGFKITSNEASAKSKEFIDIERTLIEAIKEIPTDGRLAALIFSWIHVHGNYVIVEKMNKLFKEENCNELTRDWMSALAVYAKTNCSHKWKKLIKALDKPTHLLPEQISLSAINLKGSVDYLAEYGLLLPNRFLRIRETDILSAKQLTQENKQYENRYLYGPSWRADIITGIEIGLKNPMAISKKWVAHMKLLTEYLTNICLLNNQRIRIWLN